MVHLGLDLPEMVHDSAYTDTPFHGTVHGASIRRFMKQRTRTDITPIRRWEVGSAISQTKWEITFTAND